MTDPTMVTKMAKIQVAAEQGNPLVELLESPERFKAWLSTKLPEEVVGNSLDCYNNPVANYLVSCGFRAATVDEGYVDVEIDDDYGWELCIYSDDDDTRIPQWLKSCSEDDSAPQFPKWLNQFENFLIHLPYNYQVTASYALSVLNCLEMQNQLKRVG